MSAEDPLRHFSEICRADLKPYKNKSDLAIKKGDAVAISIDSIQLRQRDGNVGL